MKTILAAVVAATCLTTISACSSAPAATAEALVSAPPAAPASKTVPLTPELAALNKAARAQGYVPRNHNGTIVFCRSEAQIGTRLGSTSCISQDDVANIVRRSIDNQDSVEALQRKSLNGPTGN